MNHHQLLLSQTIKSIVPLDLNAMEAAQKRMDALAKPPGSLGKLESVAIKLAGISGKIHNTIKNKTIVILCSDNGVVEEGVSSAPQSVTLAQTINFTKGMTGVAVLAAHYGSKLMVIDVGINADFSHPGVINKKIRPSTSNIAKGPAMSRDEAREAISVGILAAKEAAQEGADILGVGEMGIGNTTTSSSVLIALCGCKLEEVVGRGAGLTDEAFERKKAIIKQAIEINCPDKDDPIDVLSKLGGFDIAAMAGVFLGAAATKTPVVIDGFISLVAAIVATRLCPTAKEYMIGSHFSYEMGYLVGAAELEIDTLLDMDMRLGEGSGCALAFSIIEGACAVMNNMATFEQAEINNEYLANITKNCF